MTEDNGRILCVEYDNTEYLYQDEETVKKYIKKKLDKEFEEKFAKALKLAKEFIVEKKEEESEVKHVDDQAPAEVVGSWRHDSDFNRGWRAAKEADDSYFRVVALKQAVKYCDNYTDNSLVITQLAKDFYKFLSENLRCDPNPFYPCPPKKEIGLDEEAYRGICYENIFDILREFQICKHIVNLSGKNKTCAHFPISEKAIEKINYYIREINSTIRNSPEINQEEKYQDESKEPLPFDDFLKNFTPNTCRESYFHELFFFLREFLYSPYMEISYLDIGRIKEIIKKINLATNDLRSLNPENRYKG